MGAALLLAALLAVLSYVPALAQEPSGNRAALIVEYGDGRIDTFCLAFTEDAISGTDLLVRSGVNARLASGGMGTQVCKIGDVGCEPGREACFCQCLGVNCRYWTYFVLRDGAWVYSPVGPNLTEVRDGSVEAWVWGDGKQPPQTAPEGVCPSEANAAAPATAAPTSALDDDATPGTPTPSTQSTTPTPAPAPAAPAPTGCLGFVALTGTLALAALGVVRRR